MFETPFEKSPSALSRTDPRVNLLAALCFSCVAATVKTAPGLLGALGAAIAMGLAARLDWRIALSRILLVNGFVAFVWIFLPFTSPGEWLVKIGPLTATREGVLLCAAITVKSNAIVLAGIALLAARPVVDLVHAMSHLRAPGKFIHLFFFFYRYLHLIDMEYKRLTDAMRVRAFRPATDLRTYRAYAALAGSLLINSYDRSLRVRDAMKCRGFDGQYRLLNHFHMHPSDWSAAGALAALVLLTAGLEFWGLVR